MTVVELAIAAIGACEAEGVEHMLTGAFATSCYGIPRSTKDVDLVLAVKSGEQMQSVIARMAPTVEFDPQVQFDTLTWGRRQVATTREPPFYKLELFELFDDPFVQQQFSRRTRLMVDLLGREAEIPTPEDVIVQKLRWNRDKDRIDAEDVLVVQEPANLDMEYIRKWCREHGSEGRLDEILTKLPEI